MKIIFDFDHTLFSAKKLYSTLKKAFLKLGVEENLFQETFEESKGRGRDYKPRKQIKLIVNRKPEIRECNLKKTFEKVLKKTPKFFYPDTIWFLKKWQDRAKLILLSYGEDYNPPTTSSRLRRAPKFQREKITASGVKKYFKKVIITRDIDKVKPFRMIFQDKEKIVFIEDNPSALSKIKKTFSNVITIRINRGEGKYSKEQNNPQIDFSIKNLKELEKILKKMNIDKKL